MLEQLLDQKNLSFVVALVVVVVFLIVLWLYTRARGVKWSVTRGVLTAGPIQLRLSNNWC
jgi:sensor domain CHASE-containing protein